MKGTRTRDLRLLGIGTAGNSFGAGGEQVVTGLIVYQLTGSSAWVGISLAVHFIPMLLIGVPAGILADRVDRRRVLPLAEGALTLSLTGYALIMAGGTSGVWPVLAVTFISGCGRALHHTLRISYAWDIAGGASIVRALAMTSVLSRSGQFLGALLGGFVMSRYGSAGALFTLAAAHLFATLVFMRTVTRGRARKHGARESVWLGLVQYLREVRRNRALATLFSLNVTVEIFGFSYLTIIPELAVSRLGLGEEGVGILHAIRAAGGLIGGLVLTRSVRIHRPGRAYLLILMSFGVMLSLLALSELAILAMLAISLVAALASGCDIFAQSLVQRVVPDGLRGRASSMWVIAVGIGPAGHLQIGFLAAAFGSALAIAVNGLALFAFAVLAARLSPRVWRLQATPSSHDQRAR